MDLWPHDARSSPWLASRLGWLTALRLGFLSLLLVLVSAFYLREQKVVGAFSFNLGLATLGFAFALAGVYAILVQKRFYLQWVAYAQIAFDQLTWTLLAYISGGPTSGATSFYGLSCLVGAVLVGVRGALFAALTAAALYTGMCVAFTSGWLSVPRDQTAVPYATQWQDISYPLTLNLLILTVVAFLAGYLAERLQRTGGQLQAATERAEAAERLAMLGRFTAGLAHEIRNPLGSIAGSIDLLATAPSLNDEEKLLCRIIVREAARLNELVGDMLHLARPRKPEIGSVDVALVANEVIALASRWGRAEDVCVQYEGPPHGAIIAADEAHVRQVLWNLVRNAVQASSPGAQVVLRVKQAPGESGWMFEVEDKGPGIPDSALPHLFDAFFTTRAQGAGIGLAVVKRIVDEHGWRIEVQSAQGQGAIFRVLQGIEKTS